MLYDCVTGVTTKAYDFTTSPNNIVVPGYHGVTCTDDPFSTFADTNIVFDARGTASRNLFSSFGGSVKVPAAGIEVGYFADGGSNPGRINVNPVAGSARLDLNSLTTSEASASTHYKRSTTGSAREFAIGVGIESNDHFEIYDYTAFQNRFDIDSAGKVVVAGALNSGTSIEAPFIILGSAATAADAGTIRMPNAGSIQFEADAAGTDINALSVDSSEIVQIGASGASAVTITPNTTVTGTLSAGSGGFTVDADGDMVAKSITAGASTTPMIVLLDSDSPGADKEASRIVAAYIDGADGAENSTLDLYAMEAGTPTSYLQIDGKNVTVDVLKPLVIAATQMKIPSSDADPTATAGYLRHDSTVTNHLRGAVRWHDGTGIRQFVDLTAAEAEGCTDDYVIAYDSTADAFYCKADATGGGTTMANDAMWAAEGDLAIATGNDAGAVLTKGAEGTILRAGSARPAYTTATYPATIAIGEILYGSASNVISGLSAGATTDLLVGGGAAAPVWTAATGTGAPVRANTPTLITPVIGVATGTSLALSGMLTGLMPSVNVLVPSGTSTDVPSETVLTHADDGSASNAYVGMTLYNVTDSVSGTVTASTSTTITVAAGSMSWANTNVYQLGPGPTQSGSMFYVGTAGTIRHPATAGYVAGYYVNVAGVVTVDMASGSMIFQGVLNSAFATLDAGDCIDSPATKGSYYIIHNKSATEAIGFGSANVWLDGGAS